MVNLLQNDISPEVRRAAARALARFDFTGQEEASETSFTGQEAIVVEALTGILKRRKNATTRRKEDDPNVRKEAAYSINKIIARKLDDAVKFEILDKEYDIRPAKNERAMLNLPPAE